MRQCCFSRQCYLRDVRGYNIAIKTSFRKSLGEHLYVSRRDARSWSAQHEHVSQICSYKGGPMHTSKKILALVVALTYFVAAANAAQMLKSEGDDFLIQKDRRGRIIAASKILTDGTKLDMKVHYRC